MTLLEQIQANLNLEQMRSGYAIKGGNIECLDSNRETFVSMALLHNKIEVCYLFEEAKSKVTNQENTEYSLPFYVVGETTRGKKSFMKIAKGVMHFNDFEKEENAKHRIENWQAISTVGNPYKTRNVNTDRSLINKDFTLEKTFLESLHTNVLWNFTTTWQRLRCNALDRLPFPTRENKKDFKMTFLLEPNFEINSYKVSMAWKIFEFSGVYMGRYEVNQGLINSKNLDARIYLSLQKGKNPNFIALFENDNFCILTHVNVNENKQGAEALEFVRLAWHPTDQGTAWEDKIGTLCENSLYAFFGKQEIIKM